MVISVSESHNRANVRRSTDQSFTGFAEIMQAVRGTGVGTACGMATTFGCPFEGFQKPERIFAFAQRLADLGISGIALADTVGMGPARACWTSRARWRSACRVELALHLHNTRAIRWRTSSRAWTQASLLESSLGGLGGCPFAPGATGNVHRRPRAHAGEHGPRHRHRSRPADPRRARLAGARRARGARSGDEGGKGPDLHPLPADRAEPGVWPGSRFGATRWRGIPTPSRSAPTWPCPRPRAAQARPACCLPVPGRVRATARSLGILIADAIALERRSIVGRGVLGGGVKCIAGPVP